LNLGNLWAFPTHNAISTCLNFLIVHYRLTYKPQDFTVIGRNIYISNFVNRFKFYFEENCTSIMNDFSWVLRFGDDILRVDTLPKTFIEQNNALAEFKYNTKLLILCYCDLLLLRKKAEDRWPLIVILDFETWNLSCIIYLMKT